MVAKRVEDIGLSGIREIFEISKDAINLGIGEPYVDTPKEIIDGIKEIMHRHTHYTPSLGYQELREMISEKLRRENGIDADEDEVIVTCGASEALGISLLSLVERGEEVLVPDPCFVSYSSLSKLCEARIKHMPTKIDDDFRVSPEVAEEMVSKKTRIIILNTPNNPTGAVMSKEDVKAFADIATDYNIYILSDEVYEKIIYGGKHYSVGRYTEKAITVNGFSKSYAMTGWRVGYLHARKELINEFLKIHQYFNACAPSISQIAAIIALKTCNSFVKKMVEGYRERRDIAYESLKDNFICNKPDGAFYMMVKKDGFEKDRDIAIDLIKRGVAVVPGSVFGKCGKGYFRISYSTSLENLKKGLSIINKYFGGV